MQLLVRAIRKGNKGKITEKQFSLFKNIFQKTLRDGILRFTHHQDLEETLVIQETRDAILRTAA